MRLRYHTSTLVWLSLEDFHNAGLTPEEIIHDLNNMRNDHGEYLYFEPSGFNNNLIIQNPGTSDPESNDRLVYRCSCSLHRLLVAKRDAQGVKT